MNPTYDDLYLQSDMSQNDLFGGVALPTMPGDWNFEWNEETYNNNPYLPLGPAAPAAPPESPQQDQKKINEMIQQLEILNLSIIDLKNTLCKRIEAVEAVMVATQQYASQLVPWSLELHENYKKMLGAIERQGSEPSKRNNP
ncbi:hypothetical protein BU24DRAFT_456370 [Aaosphaeria arxii CBS 175.79]|uniref:Uncharacterized protein n=1 Tax=Aaosphaeria arxii CBS 175.79 TaxID=1450172 RepID=A0A6A5X666_9PLEO|nr:uncharacterized protein BU24DRAFT_456370 [Aaosphaeria arxii CBS 175.79]KAF2008337.1 hypothetical protein BU24DRAFT_456370 [Aaosphaeria arxii CBS 175.79]